jgi:ABC-type nitrate/sulfonate/bicarbonate transport systems, periplasmic components
MDLRKQNLIITTVNIVLAIILILILARPGQKPKEIDVRLATIESISSLPYWIAYEKGFFGNYGIKFKPNEVSKPLDELENTIKGGLYALFGIDYTYTIFKNAGDLGLVRVLYYTKSYGDGLIVKDTMVRIGNLNGKRIGYDDNTRYNIFLEEVLRRSGDTAVDFIGLTLDEMEGALDQGRVDAVYAVEPVLSYLESRGYKVIKREVIFTKDIPIIQGMGITSAVNISLRKDAVKRIKGALKDAVEYLKSNPEEARDVLKNRLGLKLKNSLEVVIPENIEDFKKMNEYLISKKLVPYSSIKVENILSEK